MKDKYYHSSLTISWISIVINVFIVVLKLVIGIISNSIAVLTDAIHSLSDVLSTGVVITSLYVSKRPADKTHPFGHGRAEDVGGLILSLILLFVGLGFMKGAIGRIISPQEVSMNYLFIAGVFLTIPLKLFLGIFTGRIAKDISSPLLKTDAFHHYSDFLTTLVVVGGLFFVRKGFYRLDSYLGILVSLFIVWWAFKSGKGFSDNLLGKRAPLPLYEKVKKIALSFDSVRGVHGIEIHTYGRERIISLHIELNPDLSLRQAHQVADSIEKKIHKDGLGKCVVHVDLYGQKEG